MRRLVSLRSAALIIALWCQIFLLAVPGSAQSQSFTFSAVASPGDPVEGGGRFLKRSGGLPGYAAPRPGRSGLRSQSLH